MTHSHGGHRSRLRLRAELEGLENFQAHEVIELMLFYVLPQRDINPLAHTLIEKFGSVEGVLNAPVEELEKIPGLGKVSAQWIALLGRSVSYYGSLSLDDRPQLETLHKAKQHFLHMSARSNNEEVWLFCMNQSGHLMGGSMLCDYASRSRMTLKDIMEPIIRYRTQTALIMQFREPNHLVPDEWDISIVQELSAYLSPLRIFLVDNVLLSNDDLFSLRVNNICCRPFLLPSSLSEQFSAFEHWIE